MSGEECIEFEGLLYDFADDLLPDVERLKVEEHCTQCLSCSSIVAEIRMVTSAAQSLPEPEVPSDRMWQAIDSRIQSGELVTAELSSNESSSNEYPGITSAMIIPFRTVYSQLRRVRLFAVPALVAGLVLLGIFPLWLPDNSNPYMSDYDYFSGGGAETPVFMENESLGFAMNEASSEARWELLENTFADVMLDEFTSDNYSGWD